MRTDQKVHPLLAIVVAVLVLLGVGLLSMKLLEGNNGSEKQVIAKPAHPEDPHYQADPRLAGGGVKTGNN